MFLSGLRTKSIEKKVRKRLEHRIFSPMRGKIKTVAVLQCEEMTLDKAALDLLASTFNLVVGDLNILTLVKVVESKDCLSTAVFTKEQVGWNGKLRTIELNDFCKKEYDVLINYYDTIILPLVAVSAFTNARFKVGLTEDPIVGNDLVINVSKEESMVLLEEMKKYMHILNIID